MKNIVGTPGNDTLFDTGSPAEALTINGDLGDDILLGSTQGDILNGGGNADTMIGGQGNDTYWVDDAFDVVSEVASEGTDSVKVSVNYTLGANVENLLLTGSTAISGTGNELDNVINGLVNTAANVLTGAAGNDIYFVGDGDTVVESAGGGNDTIVTAVSADLNSTDLANIENIALSGSAAVNATGNGGSNSLTGNNGANILDGGAGPDTMIGGQGNDTYVVDSATDVVTEAANEGTDLVQSFITYTLGANVENLALQGSAALNGTGNTLKNSLTGNSGANILDGGADIDTMAGGQGDDTYLVDDALDVVTEAANEGTDTVKASASYSLGDNVENLTLLGTAAINGTGNALANTINGLTNTGANILDGGAGNDTYIVGTGDTVVDSGGNDTIVAAATTDLSSAALSTIENIELTGNAAINGTGNALANSLMGNSGANVLNGGFGADTMAGGKGDDTYWVDDAFDVVTEVANEGTDSVKTSVNYTLGANVENLLLTGTTAIDGTGNALNNVINGLVNTAANVLTGAAGNDTYFVGDGDTVVESAGGGNDTIVTAASADLNSTDLANIENIALSGSATVNATGNAGSNSLTGNSGANLLDGGAGADTMIGGQGNDIYAVDNTLDVVTEATNEGADTVRSTISYTLRVNVENLELQGSATLNGTGNTLNNTLTGNSGANILDGGAGVDTMVGGQGDDTYLVDDALDMVSEAPSEGIDTVKAWSNYTLSANVENLLLQGSAAINGTGNALDNTLNGLTNSAANILNGGAGNDTYWVGTGDTVIDSGGNDTIVAAATADLSSADLTNMENLVLTGSAAINGTGNALDNSLSGNSGANVLDGGTGADTMIGGQGDDTYVVNNALDVVTEANNGGTDIVHSSAVAYTLGDNVESLLLTGSAGIDGTGNALNNTLTGNNGANILDGGTGSDTMIGGQGADTYMVDNVLDVATEAANEGTDIVKTSVTYTLGANVENILLQGSAAINGIGNELANSLTGNSGANVLNGGIGADTMAGGQGDDTYWVDNTLDVVNEDASEGNDSVKAFVNYTLASNVENLLLTGSAAISGTGNELNNVINGLVNTAANVLSGAAGNDTYFVGDGDTVVESAGGGTDTIVTATTTDLSSADLTNIENLVLTGSAVINGTGNALANSLTGNNGANVLNGGTGIDTLTGGQGDDTYWVDNTLDMVVEANNEGTDSVKTTSNYTLGANVENLLLQGTAAITGTGNALNNVINGLVNTAANVLTGAAGNDTYFVGDGDTVVESAGGGNDTIVTTSTTALINDLVNVENLVLTGSEAINGTGNTVGNSLTGNSGANILDGGAGADTMTGGQGADTYVVDSAYDVVTEAANEGTDIVKASINYTLGANIENLLLTGGTGINGTGNTLNNSLTGNSGANILDGGAGADTMNGGQGDDTYWVDDALDVLTEAANEGTDLVKASVSCTLGANVENLLLQGTEAINGTGNTLNNVINGLVNTAANILTGDAGNDTYIVGDGDSVVESAANGNDTIMTAATTTLINSLANIENIILTGTAALNGTGNGAGNSLTGNSGDNILDGSTGADTMMGGTGNDTYVVDETGDVLTEGNNGGTDLVRSYVTYTLGVNVENLLLQGSAAINGTGNTLNNSLTGNSGANVLNGGTGADTMLGGQGDDTYWVDNTLDVVSEVANEGTTDSVKASVSYTLGAYVENLLLTGTTAINGTGNALDNVLNGSVNTAANVLTGAAGNDTYFVGVGDTVVESAGGGTDTIVTAAAMDLSTGDLVNIENLAFTGSATINGRGNDTNNTLTGNSAANNLDGGNGDDILSGDAGNDILLGSSGNDQLTGGAGKDILFGGAGADHFIFNALSDLGLGTGGDIIMDFSSAASDKIDLSDLGAGFTFIGSTSFTGDSTSVIRFDAATHMLQISSDTDTAAEHEIYLVGATSIVAGDLILG